jgi:uncharacterized protein YjiS (DUF1127 family)
MTILKNIFQWLDKKDKIRQTVNELSQLSDKELSDIGIARCDIRFVAKNAYDKAI